MYVVETLVLYSLVGFVVASAFALAESSGSPMVRAVSFGAHLLMWPFFAPVLLGRAVDDQNHTAPTDDICRDTDTRIDEVEHQLMQALDAVGGIARELLGDEIDNVHRLSESLHKMERRIAEMDALLESSEFDRRQAEHTLRRLVDDPGIDEDDQRVESVRARLRNIERLNAMRDSARRDLDRAVLKMEEMISQILLLQFADQPEDQIADNIHEIASTIDGLSEGLLSR